MAYEARRSDEDDELAKKEENAKSDANNAKLVRAGLEAADKIPLDPETAAIVKGIKAADDATGGLVSNIGGKALTLQSKVNPMANLGQQALNKFADEGGLEVADKAMSAYDKAKGKGDVGKDLKDATSDMPNQVKKPGDVGGEQKGSLPSSGDKKDIPEKKGNEDLKNKPSGENVPGVSGSEGNVPEEEKVEVKDSGGEKKSSGLGNLVGVVLLSPVVAIATPLVLVLLIGAIVLSVFAGAVDYQDAFGISEATGTNSTGYGDSLYGTDQNDFYNRIIEVRNEFQEDDKTFDPLLVVSVYHALTTYGSKITYNDMTKEKITNIANAMFEDDSNVYSEETFKSKLKSDIIPSYFMFPSDETKETIVKEVFDYIDRYYSIVGKNKSSSNCSSVGSCTYNISGFYIDGSNIKKEINVSDLYVRLMQCGKYNGHNAGGTWGEPLEGEELVPFEKYILGVAYQEIGTGVGEEAFKAQMVASRSFILARPTQMGSWRTLKEENGKWILQAASCTADQVYCDPDKGCSTVAGGNGQWYQVHSGMNAGKILKGPLSSESKLRQYAADVQGEVLVNNQGNIILADFVSTETNQFTKLAKNGYDYKQILLQVYNQGKRNYGATGIYKANCGTCTLSGDYASWKQYEGEWVNVTIGTSGKTIKQIGCLATSMAIQVKRSGVATNISGEFNPGTFVEYLNNNGGFYGGNLNWSGVTAAAPSFIYQDRVYFDNYTKEQKLNKIKEIVNTPGVYAVCEVKGNTGQHWVAIDSVNGNTINMMDPGSTATDMWSEYNWQNTSQIVYYKVG